MIELIDGFRSTAVCMALRRCVYAMRSAWPGWKLGVCEGGWNSPKVFFDDPTPCVRDLADDIAGLFPAPRIEAWANLLEPGGTIAVHDHHQATDCGVLFLDSSDGPLVFPDLGYEILPQPGTLVLFGPTDRHYVSRVQNNERASISYNVHGEP